MKNGFELFGKNVNVEIIKEIKSWEKNPMLCKLFSAIQSANERQRFLDHLAEAMVARHLLKLGWKLEFEYPTCNGKQADFRAYQGDTSFFIHIKRLNTDGKTQKQMNIQKGFKALEKIKKPYTVAIQVFHDLTDLQSQHFVRVLTNFIKDKVQIGDSKDVYDDNGMHLGKCEILRIHNKGHILQMRTWAGFVDDYKRLYEKFKSAFEQFVHGELNIILVTGLSSDQMEDFETVLLGTTYEDRTVTPIDRKRQKNGFWSIDKHPASQVAGWFSIDYENDNINFGMRHRQNYQVPVFLAEVFK